MSQTNKSLREYSNLTGAMQSANRVGNIVGTNEQGRSWDNVTVLLCGKGEGGFTAAAHAKAAIAGVIIALDGDETGT